MATDQNEKSEGTYAEAIAISPEDPLLRYGHALALVREKTSKAQSKNWKSPCGSRPPMPNTGPRLR